MNYSKMKKQSERVDLALRLLDIAEMSNRQTGAATLYDSYLYLLLDDYGNPSHSTYDPAFVREFHRILAENRTN